MSATAPPTAPPTIAPVLGELEDCVVCCWSVTAAPAAVTFDVSTTVLTPWAAWLVNDETITWLEVACAGDVSVMEDAVLDLAEVLDDGLGDELLVDTR